VGASLAKTHENYAHTWWTPPEWLDWVTDTLGGGWTDPCPEFYVPGQHTCGLEYDWQTSFYCNHPGARGSTPPWWSKFHKSLSHGTGIWCAFSVEQLRHMNPSPFEIPGWLVMPKERIGFVWGGPDIPGKRKHGQRMRSPGNWTVFWSSVEPAEPPSPCVIVETGK
jgi:hypothetical protein